MFSRFTGSSFTRIGFLTNDLISDNSQRIWKGVMDAARAHDARLFCLVGGFLREHQQETARANILYDLISRENIDGLVVRGHLTSEISYEAEQAFYQRLHSQLPLIVVGRHVEGIPHLLMDSHTGMRDSIIHLIETHGCRRIAFFRGPDSYDAEERYRAYVETLRDYDIPFDPALVTPVLPTWDSERETGLRQLFDALSDGLDAVATPSDLIAQDVMIALNQRGLRVPQDIIVVGFNNSGSTTMPLLTTVDAGFYEQGKRATEMLFGLLEGRRVPDRILLPTRLLVRQSCGCLDLEVVRASAGPQVLATEPALVPGGLPQHHAASQLETLAQNASESWQEALLAAFTAEMEALQEGIFLRTLDDIIREAAIRGDEMEVWHQRISSLRQQVLTCLSGLEDISWAEDVFQQARVLVSQAMLWEQTSKRKLAQQRTDLLYEISQALVTTFDTTELMKVLARELPRLNIPRAYVGLYEQPDNPLESMRLALAYDEQGRSEWRAERQVFPTRQIVPPSLLPSDRPCTLVVEPLHFHDEHLGMAVFEVGPRDGSVYDMLRGQISSALKGAQLFRQNTQLYYEAREAQKSAEEANRLKSRFLASVSHELRMPLNMLVGLSEMLLDDDDGSRPPLPALHRQDVARIYTSARHLDDLLRDVLDLAHSQVGRLRLVRQPIDLRDVLAAVSALVEPIVSQKNLHWHTAWPDELIPVWGDAARLKQVLLNLIHNAVKFTAAGEVAMSVETGKGAVTISISDTGLGIPLEEQELIFDEFQTTQRSAARGYGGMGLGLAISRRLVEMHHGHIGVRSQGEEGRGSTFTLTLPTMSHYPAEAPDTEAPHQQTILLLTEDPQHENHLAHHLIREGFEIELQEVDADGAGWSPDSLERSPVLVILDVRMDSPYSHKLMQQVKEHPAMQNVPVLFYSLYQEQNAGSLLLLDYLAKPVDSATLARVLARYGLEHAHPQQTILVVDDDRATLDMNIRAVQAQVPGCRVLEASDGRAALEMMRQWQPDLVLLDLVMPGLDGFEVLMAMQEDEAIRHIPTIVLTGMSLTEADMERMSKGVATVLNKGVFNMDEMLTHVADVLARNRSLGSEAQRVVRKVMAYVHEHYTEPISRQDMAAHAGVSERHLDRCFQQDMGITPVTYVNRYRIQQAKILLSQTDKKVTDIALSVGFSNSTHFGRVFRREVGLSPTAYLRGIRES